MMPGGELPRTVSEDIVILMNRGTFRGQEEVMQLGQMLCEELPEHNSYEHTYIAAEGRMAFLEWAYDYASSTQCPNSTL